jgi:hypothetical protein
MGEQVPMVAGSVHETHGPLQARLQHTPWAEHTRPVPHSAVEPQVAPFGLSPHDPAMHVKFGAQSAFAVHVDLHTAAPHAKGVQAVTAGVRQAPAPSHVDWPVKFTVPAGHVESLHFVPAAYFWQAPAAQRPLLPQLAGP